jgi:hypothetical protein
MYADSTKLAVPLKDRIAALKGLIETGMDIGRNQPRATTGGLVYQGCQLGVPAASMGTKVLIVEEEICTENSDLGILHVGGELRQAGQRWIHRPHDACQAE